MSRNDHHRLDSQTVNAEEQTLARQVFRYVSRSWAFPTLCLLFWIAKRIGFDSLLVDFCLAVAVGAVLTFGWSQLATDSYSKFRWGFLAVLIVFIISIPMGAIVVILLVPLLLFDLLYLARRD